MSDWRKEWRDSAFYDEIASAIDEWVDHAAPYPDSMELEAKYWEPIIQAIEKVMETVESEAIAAERERCAMKLEEAADAIRARGQTT